MKKILFGLTALILVSCGHTIFKPNTTNMLLVGEWIIKTVDDADALISKEEFLLSAMHEKYKEGYIFKFENGAKFVLLSDKGEKMAEGQYGIGEHNDILSLQFSPKNTVFTYEIEKNNSGYNLNIKTPGELINLVIEKKLSN